MKKVTLYIIDDEEAVVTALREVFKPNKRYRVRGHTTVAGALADMAEHPPQLLICDQLMPEREGLELIAELKGRHPGLRAILLTGQSLEAELMRQLQSGLVDLYMAKPYNQAALEEAVQRLAREVALESVR